VFDFVEQETKKLHFRLIDIASVLIKYTQHFSWHSPGRFGCFAYLQLFYRNSRWFSLCRG